VCICFGIFLIVVNNQILDIFYVDLPVSACRCNSLSKTVDKFGISTCLFLVFLHFRQNLFQNDLF